MDRTILIVDSDAGWRSRIHEALREEPVVLAEAASAAEAFEQAKAHPPALLLTELELRDVTGLGLIRMLREEPVLSAPLTAREWDVMRCVAAGKTNAEIARLLWVTPGTVRKHLEHVYAKLGVGSRTAALARLQTRLA